MLFFFFLSDQHLGTRGDTLFYCRGKTDAANSEATRQYAREKNVQGTDGNSWYLIRYSLRFCSC